MIESLDQALQSWAAALGWPLEGAFRLLMAVIAGGAIGLEREARGREAGFRTNLLVCLGSCLAMVVSVQFAAQEWDPPGRFRIMVDPARVAYGVMTGVGFLGAGAIIQQRGNIHGLTTAAALWCVAATGLAAGLGLYGITIIASVLILCALWLLDYVDKFLPRMRYRTLVIRRLWEPGCIGNTIAFVKQHGLTPLDTRFQRTEDLREVDVQVRVGFQNKHHFYNLEVELHQDPTYQLLAVK